MFHELHSYEKHPGIKQIIYHRNYQMLIFLLKFKRTEIITLNVIISQTSLTISLI